ncbi:hypothetical protein [Streptomyces anulatus]|uniref:hypothetical protein n=1 Tax=Streptomyces anulatus TaxID=1892 RepID=UPI00386ED065|nr:hypothetical protein OG575_06075 [Streptomyces anulatus]
MSEYTQPALFDEADVVGTGRPTPWPHLDEATADVGAQTDKPFNIERLDVQLPFEDAA